MRADEWQVWSLHSSILSPEHLSAAACITTFGATIGETSKVVAALLERMHLTVRPDRVEPAGPPARWARLGGPAFRRTEPGAYRFALQPDR
jgi:hypothetical protein